MGWNCLCWIVGALDREGLDDGFRLDKKTRDGPRSILGYSNL